MATDKHFSNSNFKILKSKHPNIHQQKKIGFKILNQKILGTKQKKIRFFNPKKCVENKPDDKQTTTKKTVATSNIKMQIKMKFQLNKEEKKKIPVQ